MPALPARLQISVAQGASGTGYQDKRPYDTHIVAMGEAGFEIQWPEGFSPDPGESFPAEGSVSALDGVLQVGFETQSKFEFAVQLCFQETVAPPIALSPQKSVDGDSLGEPTTESRTLYLSTSDRQAVHDLLTLVRKDQHISLCAGVDVEARDRDRGLGQVQLAPCTLPELSWDDLDISCSFLGRVFKAPLCITGMTGGLEKGALINRNLAMVAQAMGIPMGVGSQRIALDHPEHADIFNVKKDAPQVFLIGNLGIAQLVGVPIHVALERAQKAVAMIDADALAIHANVLQEAVQVEGDRNFRGVYRCLETLVARLGVPVILKEVGVGVDPETAHRLMDLGIAAIDVGGKGGTSWSYIEGLRSRDPSGLQLGETYRNFGIPTGIALKLVADRRRRQKSPTALIATGGLRDGLAVAKCLGLGADLCGIGLPLLKAALVSAEAVQETLEFFIHGLKTAMLTTGSPTVAHLASRIRLGKSYRDQLEQWTQETDGSLPDDPPARQQSVQMKAGSVTRAARDQHQPEYRFP